MAPARNPSKEPRSATRRAEPVPTRIAEALLLAFAFSAGTPAAPYVAAAETGLDFPSNGQTSEDVRFRFTGANLQPMYPATYIWRVNLRKHAGYYTTFFWGPDGPFTGASYYGCHPYPDGEPKPTSRSHKWELSIYGNDYVVDANGHSTQLGYDTWKTQGLRVFDDGKSKVHEFYWDLPDTTRVIRKVLERDYGSVRPDNPSLHFGDAAWNRGNERLSGILRGLQLYASALSLEEILSEIKQPLATASGKAGVWYLNLDPTPSDISDKSGKGHHPAWASASRAGLWSSASVPILFLRARGPAESGTPSPILEAFTVQGRSIKIMGTAQFPIVQR